MNIPWSPGYNSSILIPLQMGVWNKVRTSLQKYKLLIIVFITPIKFNFFFCDISIIAQRALNKLMGIVEQTILEEDTLSTGRVIS